MSETGSEALDSDTVMTLHSMPEDVDVSGLVHENPRMICTGKVQDANMAVDREIKKTAPAVRRDGKCCNLMGYGFSLPQYLQTFALRVVVALPYSSSYSP